jgi:branched-chain amino acid transport system substrate-binding protein
MLFVLSGCSWFGGNVAQKDIMSPPQAAPVPPVEKAPVETLPMAPPASTAKPIAKVKVAILLPLSGKNAPLGQAMLNAAQQAVFDVAANNYELIPRDTGEGEAQAVASAQEVTSSGVQLLIGPLFALNVPGVRQVAQNAGVSMLTLSTDTTLAAPGLYVMGFAPDAQVERVVRYASAHGTRRFAALVPGNSYGSLVAQAFQAAVAREGGTLVALETYDPARHDSVNYVHALAEKREAIDALFLPEGGSDLNLITSQLAMAGFNNHTVHLLGTGLWDMPGLAKQSRFLAGGWYAASDPAARQKFIENYESTYAQQPPRLATLAYDATALSAVLAKRGARFDQASLTNPNGFAGLDGVFRLSPQGLVERRLAVLEVTDDGARVIDPALTTFAAAGSN